MKYIEQKLIDGPSTVGNIRYCLVAMLFTIFVHRPFSSQQYLF